MTTHCAKCGFDGQDDDQCERCGIIFEKMHTILEVSPLAHLALPKAPAPRRVYAKDDVESPKVAISAGAPPRVAAAFARSAEPHPARIAHDRGALDRDATSLDVPLVPRVERVERKSRAVPLSLVALALAGTWAFVEWRDGRDSRRPSESAPIIAADAAYFDVSIEALVADLRRSLAAVHDPAAARADAERIATRLAHLEAALGASGLAEGVRAPYADALAALGDYLRLDLPPVLDAALADPSKAVPVPDANLAKVAALLARAREATPASPEPVPLPAAPAPAGASPADPAPAIVEPVPATAPAPAVPEASLPAP